MGNLFIMVECPGSGKSWYAENRIKRTFNDIVYVSRDEIRFTMLKSDEEYFSHEKEVFKKYIERINMALVRGQDVIADATHLNEASRRKLLSNVHGEDKVIAVVLNTPIETCLERNSHRSNFYKVPEKQLMDMYLRMTIPSLEEEQIDEVYIIKPNKKIERIIKEEY